jgi:hypothetical protein
MKRWTMLAALALLVGNPLPAHSAQGRGCCLFFPNEPTLMQTYREASLVVYAYFTNPKVDKNSVDGGTSDLVIEKVLKSHAAFQGKHVITIPRLLPDAKDKKFIVFCDVYNDNINPFRAEEVVRDSILLDYFTGFLKFKDQPDAKRLRYCFDYLNSTDPAVAIDAYHEFQKADYADLQAVAKNLPPQTIVGWLGDPKTPSFRRPLYAFLLGHCGNPKTHGDILRAILDDPKIRESTGVEGVMTGYVMLQPQEGWKFLKEILQTEKAEQFNERYWALNTLRFFWSTRPDVLSKQQLLQGMDMALAAPDIADFAIDDLRTWKQWDKTGKILDLFKIPSHDNPVIDRAILRFALSNKTPRTDAFVAAQRKRDPVWVSDTEELLRADEAILNKLAPPNKQ